MGDRAGPAPLADLVALQPQLGIGVHPARPDRQARRAHPGSGAAVRADRPPPDVLDLRVVTGQSVTDWQKQAEALAATWRAERLTIRATAPGELRITIMRGDVLADPVRLPDAHPASRWTWPPCGSGSPKPGTWWRLPVLGQHILVAGATGAGKGSVLWSLIAGLAPAVRDRAGAVVRDRPQRRHGTGRGAPLFSVFSHDTGDTTLELLRALVARDARAGESAARHTRLHTPTPAEPLIVLIVDEIAALTAYVTDRKTRTEIEQLLGLLLSQGRAVGISVIAAMQDPSKDTLPVRQLFTVRIGLRMTESTQTAMVLGRGTRRRRGMRPHPRRHPWCRLRDDRRHRRTRYGSGPSTSPTATSPSSPPFPPPALAGTSQRTTEPLHDRPDGVSGDTVAADSPTVVLPGLPDAIDHEPVIDQMVRRASSPGFESWWRRAESVGFCANPIHLTGADPFGRRTASVWARCNNRRATVCPSCSDLYARDTWQLVHAGAPADTTTSPPRSPNTRKCSPP